MQVNITLIKGYLGFVIEREFCIVERKIEGFLLERQRRECDKESARVILESIFIMIIFTIYFIKIIIIDMVYSYFLILNLNKYNIFI